MPIEDIINFEAKPIIEIEGGDKKHYLYYVKENSSYCPYCENIIKRYIYSVVEGSTDDKDHHIRIVPCPCMFDMIIRKENQK